MTEAMSLTEQERKLKDLATMSAGELAGWELGREVQGRPYFEGELAAITRRKKELKVKT